MKKIMAKYNHAFGYVKGYFTLCGLVGLGAMIAGFVLLFTGEKVSTGMSAAEMALGMIIPGIILVLIAATIVLTTRKKCPQEKRGMVGLTLSMMIVGLGAAFVLAWKIVKFTLRLVGIRIGSSTTTTESLATIYYKGTNEADEWSCKDCGNYAVLTGTGAGTSRGETVTVHRHGNDNILCDDAGNLYYPK